MVPGRERRLANKAAAALFRPANSEGASRPHPPGANRGDYRSVSVAQMRGRENNVDIVNGQSDEQPLVNSIVIVICVLAGVPDPWHFTRDPDPRICTFKIKCYKEVTKQYEIKVFLNFFACWWKDPDTSD